LFEKSFKKFKELFFMKKLLFFAVLITAFSFTAFAQEKMGEMKMDEKKPTVADKVATFDAKGTILRGAPLGKSKKVSLAKIMENPGKYAGKSVRVEGVVVRSCKMEGCWMELAPSKDAKSVRVKFKDHAFFIPLQSAGFKAKAEGVFSVKTLSKEEVKHLVDEDGAKFDNINADGTVTEIAFEASGVELTKAS
jgi:hypothetical protein